MKGILIGFEDQCPAHIEHTNTFIGNWEGFLAVIVTMPYPGKSYTLETAIRIDEKMDVQLGTFKKKEPFTSVHCRLINQV